MGYLLALYGLAACALLVWVTVSHDRACNRDGMRSALSYDPISPSLLNVWRICCSNLILIKLCPANGARRDDDIPEALVVERPQLTGILLWLPPGSKLVLYEESDLTRFDRSTETVLLSFGINTVYFLAGGIEAWRSQRQSQPAETLPPGARNIESS